MEKQYSQFLIANQTSPRSPSPPFTPTHATTSAQKISTPLIEVNYDSPTETKVFFSDDTAAKSVPIPTIILSPSTENQHDQKEHKRKRKDLLFFEKKKKKNDSSVTF